MLVMIGCSGSSGSTFFSQLLDRHPEIASGEELQLFSKVLLYDDYHFVLKRFWLVRLLGLGNQPYDQGRAFLRQLDSYSLSQRQAWNWVRKSRSITELAECFQRHILTLTAKRIWVEKTPANLVCTARFLDSFPLGKVIHLVRDPRDTIVSLMKRSKNPSPLFGAKTWLCRVASVYPYRDHPRILEIRYDALVQNTPECLERVCDFLGVDFDWKHFQSTRYHSRNLKKFPGHPSWNLNPAGLASSRSVGKYRSSNVDFHEVSKLKLTEKFAGILGVSPMTLQELAGEYGYTFDSKRSSRIQVPGKPVDKVKKIYGLKKHLYDLVQKHDFEPRVEI